MRATAETFKKDLLHNQPHMVRVLVEGQGKVVQYRRVADRHHVPVGSSGGWDKLDYKYALAKKATSEFRLTGRKTLVFHAGDFDPDGVALSEHIARDVRAFLSDLLPYGADPAEVLVFKRIMLLEHQVPEDRKVPFDRSKVKKNDHRGQQWPHA
jgi:hypothetical protein